MPVNRPPESAALSTGARTDLAQRQSAARGYPRRSPEIQTAWRAMQGEPVWRELRDRVHQTFDEKCVYCEDIVARDVEHYYPKSRYPERMFRWDNLLLACKNCNTDKGQRFPLLDGQPLLIDPCAEDPALFLQWDLSTGRPIVSAEPLREAKARATVAALPQLRHQALADQRRDLARKVQFLLLQVVEDNPTPPDACAWLEEVLQPTRPWRSVVRQIVRDPAYQRLIQRVREQAPQLIPQLDALGA